MRIAYVLLAALCLCQAVAAGQLYGEIQDYRDARQAIVAYKRGHGGDALRQARRLGLKITDVSEELRFLTVALPPDIDMQALRTIAAPRFIRYVEPNHERSVHGCEGR